MLCLRHDAAACPRAHAVDMPAMPHYSGGSACWCGGSVMRGGDMRQEVRGRRGEGRGREARVAAVALFERVYIRYAIFRCRLY